MHMSFSEPLPYDPAPYLDEVCFTPFNYSLLPPENFVCLRHTMYAISDRQNFNDSYQFSADTKIRSYVSSNDGICPEREVSLNQQQVTDYFSHRKVLVLVHGFTVHADEFLKVLHKVSGQVSNTYDTVIAYLYPAGKSLTDYGLARRLAVRAACTRLPSVLGSITYVAKQVDIAAHSMGAFTVLNALNQPAIGSIRNLFLMGGADRQESILDCTGSKCTSYPDALKKAHTIHVLSSCNDEALPFHTLFLKEKTLGRPGSLPKHNIAKNVKLVNMTRFVKSHSDYFENITILNFIMQASTLDTQNFEQGKQASTLTNQEVSPSDPIVCQLSLVETISITTSQITRGVIGSLPKIFKN